MGALRGRVEALEAAVTRLEEEMRVVREPRGVEDRMARGREEVRQMLAYQERVRGEEPC